MENIVELLGANNEQHVIDNFNGMSYDQILNELNEMFPGENNEELSSAILAML